MPEVQSFAARVARAAKTKNPAAEVEARQALAAAKITAYVEKVLAAAPPLSDQQRAALAELLRPARSGAS